MYADDVICTAAKNTNKRMVDIMPDKMNKALEMQKMLSDANNMK